MHQATFVLSTGRCGTQWLAEALGQVFAERLRVEHEPLHLGYRPRERLAQQTPLLEVQRHLDAIEDTLAHRPYLECGHPCWSALPWIAQRLRGRVRVIHLVRHPVPTALSWLTHQAYQPPLLPHLPEKVLLSPFDAGVRFPEYRERWQVLTPFEKCLYYWLEVNAFALTLEAEGGLPWLRLRFEDLFAGDGLEPLLGFLALPQDRRLDALRGERIDRHQSVLAVPEGIATLVGHPEVVALAQALGYGMDGLDESALQQRYLPQFTPQALR
jgi:hypothetical protein